MDKLSIFDIELDNKHEFTEDQLADTIIQSQQAYAEAHTSVRELNESIRAYNNIDKLLQAQDLFADDKNLHHLAPSMEAWKLDEAKTKIVEKFRTFFKKIFSYITSFFLLRIEQAANTVNKWEGVLTDNSKKDKIEKVKKEYTVKGATTESIKFALEKAHDAYSKVSTMVTNVKGMNPTEGDDGTKTTESLTLPADTAEYKAFFEQWQKFEKMNPVGENKDTTEAVDADSGKWFDDGAVKGVREQIEKIKSVFANIKRLQADCDAVVKSLEKSSTNDKDNAKQLNEAKIKWLSDVSKNILGAMLRHILTMVGYAASKSQTLTNMVEK